MDQLLERLRTEAEAESKPLRCIPVLSAQYFQLLSRLHTSGDHLELEASCQGDDGGLRCRTPSVRCRIAAAERWSSVTN